MAKTERFTIRTQDGIALRKNLDFDVAPESFDKLQTILYRLADYEDRFVSLNDLADDIHQNAVDHGWWDEPRSFGDIIALCHSELSKALEEYRAGRPMVWFVCEEIKDKPDICNPADEWDCTEYRRMNGCKYRGKKPEGIAVDNDKKLNLVGVIAAKYDLSPAGIIKALDLKRPIYEKLAGGCHFREV